MSATARLTGPVSATHPYGDLVGRPRRGGAGHVVGCAIAGAEPVDGVVPSDHYAVVADLRY